MNNDLSPMTSALCFRRWPVSSAASSSAANSLANSQNQPSSADSLRHRS
jgi:hypothetical protein